MSNEPSPQSPASPAPTRPNRPPLVPIAIALAETVALAALAYAERAEWLSPANAFLAKFSTAGVGVILLFLWFVFFAPVARNTRVLAAGLGVAVVVLGMATLRIEGVTGDIYPRVRFRWSPHADETLGKFEVAEGESVDLSATTDHDYPQFMGANRLATLTGAGLSADWSAHKPKELWRQPIGAGWSSFAVVGNFAVTQEQRGAQELITCYEVDTGKPRWAHATPVRFAETLAGIGPRATPTIHDGKVYALGALGHLTCLDGATGKQLWQRNVVTDFGAEETKPIWGKSCSPLVHEDKVIVSAGGPDGKSLVALDRNSGELVWSGGDDASSYSSPVLMTLAGVPQIVIVNAKSVVAHDPGDGRVLWRESWPEGAIEQVQAEPSVAQPIPIGDDQILLSKGYGTGSALWKITREGDTWSVQPVWRKKLNLKTKFTSPVILDDYAYALDEGVLECVDVATGDKQWKRGKYGHGQLLLVDDLLLVQAENGDVALVKADPERFVELARFPAVSGTGWNPPALSGRKLLVRSNAEAACYELPAASL
ncbi:MAG: PQQ-binding-like beta-propeller repeat protein [Pirellulales bacterium]